MSAPNNESALIRQTQPLEPLHPRPQLHVDIKNTNHVDGPPSDGIRKIMKQDMISTLAMTFDDIDSLIIFTKPANVPRIKDVFSQFRFQLRILQVLFSIMSFLSLGYTAFNTNYTSVLLTSTGISFYVFANCVSLVLLLIVYSHC